MIPELYDSNATVFGEGGSPIAHLTDAISCIVEEKLNDSFELTMEYDLNGLCSQYFINNENTIGGTVSYGKGAKRIIYAKPNPDDDPEPFRIYKISKPFNGTITISAEHISYDLSGTPIRPFSASDIGAALINLKQNELIPSLFTYENVDLISAKEFKVENPESARSILGGSEEDSIIGVYGGELKYEKFNVKVYSRRGSDRGFKIKYGYNLLDLTDDYDCSECFSGVLPYYSSTQDSEPVLIFGAEVVPTYSSETVLHEQELPSFSKIGLLNLTEYFESTPTAAQLKTKAQEYVTENNLYEPDINLSLSFAKLSDYDGYEDLKSLERVGLGDTVLVTNPNIGVSRSKRVIFTSYDVLKDRYDSIELGTPAKSLSGTIYDVISGNSEAYDSLSASIARAERAAQDHADQVAEAVRIALSTAIQNNTNLIKSVNGGYVVDHYNQSSQRYEMLIVENLYTLYNTEVSPIVEWTPGHYPEVIPARISPTGQNIPANIWRWNSAGLAFSSKGYEGGASGDGYRTAIMNNGSISADFITTGELDASKLTVSNINAGSIVTGTLDCSLLNVIHLSADSISAGTISADYIRGGNLNCGGSGGVGLTNFATSDYPINLAHFGTVIVNTSLQSLGTLRIGPNLGVAQLTTNGITFGGETKSWSSIVHGTATAVFG